MWHENAARNRALSWSTFSAHADEQRAEKALLVSAADAYVGSDAPAGAGG